jgi:hypothetical protein
MFRPRNSGANSDGHVGRHRRTMGFYQRPGAKLLCTRNMRPEHALQNLPTQVRRGLIHPPRPRLLTFQ